MMSAQRWGIFIAVVFAPLFWWSACAHSASAPPIKEASIALPHTSGRIDHLSVDRVRKRLFVAEIGNGTLDVINVDTGRVTHRISHLSEPQGVAYVPSSDKLVVANGGDGTVRIYDGKDFSPVAVIKLDADADNVHVDPLNGHVVVGHGSGGLAVIDPGKSAWLLSDVPLPAHPEGFAIAGRRAFVNVPDAGAIEVVDLDAMKVVAEWKPLPMSGNFPLAFDDHGHVAVVFRGQSKFALLDADSGRIVAAQPTCGDADDIFFDASSHRFFVSCGDGALDTILEDGAVLRELDRVHTSWGARTSLFVPEWNRLFVAERAGLLGSNATISVFRASTPEK
jgi:DNA-binding beta-propeller fold protein YncE